MYVHTSFLLLDESHFMLTKHVGDLLVSTVLHTLNNYRMRDSRYRQTRDMD